MGLIEVLQEFCEAAGWRAQDRLLAWENAALERVRERTRKSVAKWASNPLNREKKRLAMIAYRARLKLEKST